MIVLGIDPGIATIGYGLIEEIGNSFKPLAYGSIVTPANKTIPERLLQINNQLSEIIVRYKPAAVSIEKLFFNKNTKTALMVAEARGAIILTLSMHNLGISEYTPLQVKESICGYGRADKKQVQYMVKTLLSLAEVPKPDDTADALAIAICHIQFSGILNKVKGYLA